MAGDRRRDVVLFGATSFVGRLVARHLLERHGATGDGPEQLTWAIAGRSRERLEQLRDELGPAAGPLDLLVVDAHDRIALEAMASGTRVVATTVGPYALHGSALVAACASTGTDYCDLSGEVQWIRRMLDEHHAAAVASGARLVPAGGFDSVPSDLGVHVLQAAAVERFGVPARRVRLGVRRMKGGVSGGTLASMLTAVREARSDAAMRRRLADPYALCPPDARHGPRQPNVVRPERDEALGGWVAPFFMASVNTRVVHRTNAVQGHPYGPEFTYDEVVVTGRGVAGAVASAAVTAGIGAFVAAAALPLVGDLLERALPGSGEGPSPEAQEAGSFLMELHGRTAAGEELTVRVAGDRDPGYGATAGMLGELAACLARDVPARSPEPPGGFWTPASLGGDEFVGRLREHAGLTFEVA